MNSETLFALILGHCWGDYLTQNAWMAFNKKRKCVTGFIACSVHCLIYTFYIMLALILSETLYTTDLNFLYIFILMFFSHYVIDRYSIIENWLKYLRARSWDTHIDLKSDYLTTKESMFLSFGAIVYVVADNTIHLTLMYFILKVML